MSQATDLLNEWIQKCAVRAPSITRTGAQRWPQVGPPPHFKPGIASFGWGINGALVRNQAGTPIGLSFGSIDVWFSDRGLDLNSPPPGCGQQFTAGSSDLESMRFTLDGDQVRLDTQSVTWGSSYTVWTATSDVPSGQLLFSDVPPAGPDPVRSFLVVGFADTGAFGWL
jgi:hypothetical protein